MTTILHVGDLHYWAYAKNPMLYLGKRGLGSANLFLKRSKAFRIELTSVLANRLHAESANAQHLLFSGDFSTTSLPKEFTLAAEAFSPLLKNTFRAHAVPGNHDRYTARDLLNSNFEKHLLAKLCPMQKPFPFIEHLCPEVACAGFDATTRNGIGSFGFLKPDDLVALQNWWSENGRTIKQLIVLCHFPPEAPAALLKHNRGQQLRNGEALLGLLKELNIPVLFCQGHYHQRWLWRSELAENVVYLNAGAPLMRSGMENPDLGFFRFNATPQIERVTLVRCTDLSEQETTWCEHNFTLPPSGPGIDLRAKVLRMP